MAPFNPLLPVRFPRLSFLLSPVIRPQCLVCHRALRPVFPATPTLCHRCVPRESLSVDRTTHCSSCGLSSADPTCERCFLFPLPFASFHASFHYRGVVRDLVRAMKFTPSKKLARVIAKNLATSILTEPPPLFPWELVIPIPSGPHSSRKRLFTPTIIAAREIGSAIGMPVVPSALSAHRRRALQASLLSTKERFANSREAFNASSKVVRDKHILLVDDVITTGATIAAATVALLDAGAATVRTGVRPTENRELKIFSAATKSPRFSFTRKLKSPSS